MHWTYSRRPNDSDLQQGDFLQPTKELQEILKEVHPQFCADKYIGFVVTTQTCDLVQRGAKSPKAQYINISTVRSLKETTPQFFEKILKPVRQGIFIKSDQGKAKDFLRRLFNQNEQALGLFYFHNDADIGLGDPSVAFLRVVFTLHAKHYSTLVSARKGGLNPEFQAKFGWLVGNLFSRAATSDWSDKEGGPEELENLEKLYLEECIPELGPVWLDGILVAEAKKNNFDFSKHEFKDLEQELEKYRPTPSIKVLIEEIAEVAKKALKPHSALLEERSTAFNDAKDKILKIFEKQFVSASTCKDGELGIFYNEIETVISNLETTASELLIVNDEKIAKFSNRLGNNRRIKKLIK